MAQMDRGKNWCHSQMCLLYPNTRNRCFEDALHHLATLRALLQRLEPVGLTVPSMSRCLSLSPFLMFLSKTPRPPSWYDITPSPKLPQGELGCRRDFLPALSIGVSRGQMGKTLMWGRAKSKGETLWNSQYLVLMTDSLVPTLPNGS